MRVAVPREVPAIFCPAEKSVVASVSPGAWTFHGVDHDVDVDGDVDGVDGPSPIEHGVSVLQSSLGGPGSGGGGEHLNSINLF